MWILEKRGCPTKTFDHKLSVPIHLIGENDEHIKQFENG